MSMNTHRSGLAGLLLVVGAAGLSSCGDREPAPAPEGSQDGETRSIFRPEFQVEAESEKAALAALDSRVFLSEGLELSQQARAELATIAGSPQSQSGGDIILRGHSDAGGSDEVNMRASIARAEAVRDFLLELGVDEERITIIGFGEQNPIAPNALPDGTPNEAGRAKNRRVDVHVAAKVPVAEVIPTSEEDKATLAESLAESASEKEASPGAKTPSE